MTAALDRPEAQQTGGARAPDLSLIVPCFNEEAVVEKTIGALCEAFERAGRRLQIIAVDNGSTDRTGEILARMAADRPTILTHRVEVNIGYGNGVLSAIPLLQGRWAGIIPADGQVDADDVVKLFEAADASDGRVVAKVRRRFRMDGMRRKIVSVFYNLFFRALWPGIQSLDINGSPKILGREDLQRMDLRSTSWCLDPELMVKAHSMGLRVLEVNVFARMRGGGTSHVRAATLWEFFSTLVGVRFFGRFGGWRVPEPPVAADRPAGAMAMDRRA